MALKNKDGSTYTLAKPNPIMKHQSLWANEKYLLHNMKWKVEVFVDENDSNAIEENQVESRREKVRNKQNIRSLLASNDQNKNR
jgi:hypothetical protein